MRLKCLGCDALARIVYLCAAQSPHVVDVELFRIGLHNEPADLRNWLQEGIDAASGQEYDAVVLAYGLIGAHEGLLNRVFGVVRAEKDGVHDPPHRPAVAPYQFGVGDSLALLAP